MYKFCNIYLENNYTKFGLSLNQAIDIDTLYKQISILTRDLTNKQLDFLKEIVSDI
jgi:hypothetical protein